MQGSTFDANSDPSISNGKKLLELIVLQCVLYKSIHFLIQLEQSVKKCIIPSRPQNSSNTAGLSDSPSFPNGYLPTYVGTYLEKNLWSNFQK